MHHQTWPSTASANTERFGFKVITWYKESQQSNTHLGNVKNHVTQNSLVKKRLVVRCTADYLCLIIRT